MSGVAYSDDHSDDQHQHALSNNAPSANSLYFTSLLTPYTLYEYFIQFILQKQNTMPALETKIMKIL